MDTYVQVFPSLVRTADLVTTQATCSRCSLFSNSCSSSSSITAIAHCHRLGLLLATRATTVSGRCALRLGPKCALTHWQLTARVPSLFFGTQAPRGKAKSQSPAPIIPITRNEPPLPLILSLLVLNHTLHHHHHHHPRHLHAVQPPFLAFPAIHAALRSAHYPQS